jgi:hypothetical protein
MTCDEIFTKIYCAGIARRGRGTACHFRLARAGDAHVDSDLDVPIGIDPPAKQSARADEQGCDHNPRASGNRSIEL